MDFSNLELDSLDLWFGKNELSEKKRENIRTPFGENTSRNFHVQLLGVHGLGSSKDRGD